MKYKTFTKKERVLLYLLILLIYTVLLVSFFNAFIDVNEKRIHVFDTLLEWFLYVFLVMVFSGFLLSLANSFHELNEDRLILRFGILGFMHIRYSDISAISEYNEKDIPFGGMRILKNTCYMAFAKRSLVKIELKKKVRVYYLFFFKRWVDTTIFSVDKREEFIKELNKKAGKMPQ